MAATHVRLLRRQSRLLKPCLRLSMLLHHLALHRLALWQLGRPVWLVAPREGPVVLDRLLPLEPRVRRAGAVLEHHLQVVQGGARVPLTQVGEWPRHRLRVVLA